MGDAIRIKQVPPSNLEAERIVLGLIMMNNTRIEEVKSLLKPDDFYSSQHQLMFDAMLKMAEQKAPIEANTVYLKLGKLGDAKEISGCLDGVSKNHNIMMPAMSIRENSILRQIITQSSRVIDTAYRGDLGETVTELLVIPLDEYARRYHATLREKLEEWSSVTNGYFSVTDIQKALQIVTPREKSKLRVTAYRLVKDGEWVRHPSRDGVFRRVEQESELLDWINASDDEYPLNLPFGLNKLVHVLPRSVICIAGIPNAGKTACLLDIVRLNMKRLKINYFTSELGPQKLKKRLQLFQNVPFPGGWKFVPYYRTANFPDAVKQFPDDLTIIDYIEQTSDAYLIATSIRGVFDQLDKGVAIVAIQKKLGSEWGWGGEGSLQIPSLYLAIEHGWVKIIKAKEWKDGIENPEKKMRPFKLRHGAEFEMTGEWRSQDELDAIKEPHPWSPKKDKWR